MLYFSGSFPLNLRSNAYLAGSVPDPIYRGVKQKKVAFVDGHEKRNIVYGERGARLSGRMLEKHDTGKFIHCRNKHSAKHLVLRI
jgi:hypothetical protein